MAKMKKVDEAVKEEPKKNYTFTEEQYLAWKEKARLNGQEWTPNLVEFLTYLSEK